MSARIGDRRARRIRIAVGLAALWLLGWSGLVSPPGAGAAGPALTTAPEFTLNDLEGTPRSFASLRKEKPVLLEFMSLNCPHCLEMAPVLTRLYAAENKRLQFLTLAFDRESSRVAKLVKREKHAWPYLMGTEAVAHAYRVEGVPTFFLVAPDGRVLLRHVGSTSFEDLSAQIRRALQ